MTKINSLFYRILPIVYLLVFNSCQSLIEEKNNLEKFKSFKEQQLTFGNQGHFLNHRQVFSADDKWAVFDNRNDGSEIMTNGGIAMLNLETKEIRNIYQVPNQNDYGPGVGAAVFNPKKDEVVFIHGLSNFNVNQPYDFTRRTAVAINPFEMDGKTMLDARDISAPFTPGALRGGTHAYSFSADGEWISFTYNDYIIQQLAKTDSSVKDLRTVGAMLPQGAIEVNGNKKYEDFSGKLFSIVAAVVTESPIAGSDEISKAYEEGWVGDNGYFNAKGELQKRALAFLGDVVDKNGNTVTEVFITDFPDSINDHKNIRLGGTKTTRPKPPNGMQQRRLTFTQDRKFPGVQGPRQWLLSTPDGSLLFFPMKDNNGVVQIFAVSPNGGKIKQITQNDFSMETSFSLDPKGKFVAYGHDRDIYISKIHSGKMMKIPLDLSYKSSDLSNINWSYDGKTILYNRKVKEENGSYYQIFSLKEQENE